MGKSALGVVLIVTADPARAEEDRLALRLFGPGSVLHFTGGAEALDYLHRQGADLVLLDATLRDMDGTRFLGFLRQTPAGRRAPVVMVTAEGGREAILDAVAAGCAGYVLRPYTLGAFRSRIEGVLAADRAEAETSFKVAEAGGMVALGHFEDAVAVFESVVAGEERSRAFFEQGLDLLASGEFGAAADAFRRALRLNELFAEAYAGLAEAYKGLGRERERSRCLARAAGIHAEFDRFEECRRVFVQVLKADPDAANPYNELGIRLRRSGDPPGAVLAYRRALALSPGDANIHVNLAKALLLMGDHLAAGRETRRALAISPGHETGRALYRRLFGREWSGG